MLYTSADSTFGSSDSLLSTALLAFVILYALYVVCNTASRLILHPLARFPGPRAAAASFYWQPFVKIILGRSFTDELVRLHKKHGKVVRIGPKELHFSDPQAYHDIYNASNRWDKEETLYHSFGEDRSSFGFLDYRTAKERKDILSKSFSVKAMEESEPLVQQKVEELCDAMRRYSAADKAFDASRAFRCFTLDVITHLCFGIPIDAVAARDFAAPIVVAMDESLKILPGFRYFPAFKHAIMDCPPGLSKILSPLTAGLVELQQILRTRIDALAKQPETLDHFPHQRTIFHTLMSPEAHKTGVVPDTGSLYEESQALMFGGGDTAGNALMVICYHLVKRPDAMLRLRAELRQAWPDLSSPEPKQRELENLPYLNAVLREGLRLSHGVVAGLLRIVPPQGAQICGQHVPGGTIVSCSSPFVHLNADLFPDPHAFQPERWIDGPGASALPNWLVAFSRGPRSCLGLNLAWLELRLMLAATARRFDLALDGGGPDALRFKEAFLPHWVSAPVMLRATPVPN